VAESPSSRPPKDDHYPRVTAEGFAGQDDIFFAAVEMTRMPMVVTDPNQPDNPIVFANVAFQELTGYRAEEILGRNCRFLQGPTSDAETVAQVRAAIEARTDVAVELLNYRKDGSAFWNALFISPVFDGSGKLLYFFASQLDVSRRRDAEEALRQAQKMEAVGQLTGGLAHDFNNMLTVIMGNIDSALARSTEAAVRTRLDRALEGARRAETLTAQLLAFARKQRLDGRVTNLNLLVRGLKDMLDRTLGGDVEIRLDFADRLGLARVDAVQTEVALLNVLINARDAMPGGGQVTISTRDLDIREEGHPSGARPGRYAALCVEDTGGGMPPDVLARVTEPFFTTKDVGKGTGMGLAMVYGFMRQSHGFLHIASEPGRGTTVQLLFPVVEGEPAGLPERPQQEIRGGHETILMVEDNPGVMDMGRSALEDFGYTVVTATHGAAALALLKDGLAPDLLFSDIVMPGGLNGVSLAHEVRRLRPALPVLLTTGWADRALDSPDARAGYEILPKPYRRADLARRVRMLLDGPTGVS
jgi:PAS domain S-box-containing protein